MDYIHNKVNKAMSYQREQYEKNEQLISKEMAGCDNQDINEVARSCHQSWATDSEAKAFIKWKKEEISKRANEDEVNEVFKNVRV